MALPLLKVPLENFAFEILEDLPKLLEAHSTGVSIHALHEWYNESPQRIQKALSLLEQRQQIRILKSANNSSYILPFKAAEPVEFGDLSDLQRSTVTFIRNVCRNAGTTRLSTNYMQLMRQMKCSATGIRTCVDRLVQLGYLEILHPSKHGKQNDLVIGLGKKITDHHLNS